MITALKEGNKIKAAQYWPDKDNANIELPNCKLKYESHTYPGTYFHRKMSLDVGEGPRTVHQLQTNAWKDKTAPSRSKILLDLVYKTQELVKENPGWNYYTLRGYFVNKDLYGEILLNEKRDMN